jgi:hypothetical protein
MVSGVDSSASAGTAGNDISTVHSALTDEAVEWCVVRR